MAGPESAGESGASALWHDVPRLDRPSRLWLVSSDKAAWVVGGLAPAALALNFDYRLLVDPALWVLAIVGTTAGVLGAFCQPERRSLPRWAMAWLSFAASPHRAAWKPGRSPVAY